MVSAIRCQKGEGYAPELSIQGTHLVISMGPDAGNLYSDPYRWFGKMPAVGGGLSPAEAKYRKEGLEARYTSKAAAKKRVLVVVPKGTSASKLGKSAEKVVKVFDGLFEDAERDWAARPPRCCPSPCGRRFPRVPRSSR